MKLRFNHNSLMLTVFASAPLLSSCQHMDVAQITYEVLRAEDCRRNQLEDFCSRNYSAEYHDYKHMRQGYLRDEQATTALDNTHELTLHKVLNQQ